MYADICHLYWANCSVLVLTWPATVKPETFACPIFREFRNLGKFAKITGRKCLIDNQLFSTSLTEPNTNANIMGSKN